MKRFSIKQLVIVFIIGSVLLTGAKFFATDSSAFVKGNHKKMMQECMVDGDFSEEQMESFLEKGVTQRGFRNFKHR